MQKKTFLTEILFGAKSWSYNIISLLFESDVLVHLLPLLDLSLLVPSPLSFIQMCKSNPVLMMYNVLVYVLCQQACVASFSLQIWASHLFLCALFL